MESIRENRPLMISLVGTYSFIVFLALGWSSDLCEQFGIIQFPEEVRLVIQSIIRIRAFYSSERQFIINMILSYFSFAQYCCKY